MGSINFSSEKYATVFHVGLDKYIEELTKGGEDISKVSSF